MPDIFTEQELKSFLKIALEKSLTLEESKKALLIKGWPKKFVEKYCTKYYKIIKKREYSARKKTDEQLEKDAKKKENIIKEEIERIDDQLTKLK
ncbi:MAG: hypothetical protein V3V78_01870 [Candidatus Woesearchaeota archaeon]